MTFTDLLGPPLPTTAAPVPPTCDGCGGPILPDDHARFGPDGDLYHSSCDPGDNSW